ncbi:MAG: ABC transporter ATP-binding protein [Caldiserica bacterium]|nr:ABC transporter ATP-binding protein [Caldisericota bacterium]MDH7563105.1 ABC transporter ATP-binding protein [Caldisericota bacterium]
MIPLISLKDIGVKVGKREFLEIENLDVLPGETLAILGPTGSGKTTLLKLLAFLIRPFKGEMFWKEEKIQYPVPLSIRRSVSMAFQDTLFFEGSVLENVSYGLRIRGIKGREMNKRVEEVLELFSISHLKNQEARKVSGGEGQKVALARSLVFSPSLLLLDEPFSSLDPLTKEEIILELKRGIKNFQITCIFVTHDQEEAFALADRIAVIDRGRILQIGNKCEVFFRPLNLRVARFVGVENLFPALIVENREGLVSLKTSNWFIEAVSDLSPGKIVTACIRPEDIILGKDGKTHERTTARNRLKGKVIELEPAGAVVKVKVDCGITLKAIITRRSSIDLDLKPGDEVFATFKATACHLIPQEKGERDG